jgi:O-antigen/teichoic acid export membrane protein
LLYACGKVKRAAWIGIWEAAISVACGCLLVWRYGAAGLAAGIAIARLIMSGFWLTIAACKLTSLSLATLMKSVLSGLALPLVILILEIGAIWSMLSLLSSWQLVLAGVAAGCIYLAFLGAQRGFSFWPNQTESLD